MRIDEFAREHGYNSLDIVNFLRVLGYFDRNEMSSLTDDMENKLLEYIDKSGSECEGEYDDVDEDDLEEEIDNSEMSYHGRNICILLNESEDDSSSDYEDEEYDDEDDWD